jgi:hypothetical protein
MICDWCHKPLDRSEAQPQDHLEFHPACFQFYLAWLRQIQVVCGEEIRKSKAG